MARTAVVNPRRGRGGRFVKGGSKRRRHKRRRHNYGAAVANPRRRRRHRRSASPARHYARHTRRRRRNPTTGISPYSSGGYRRRPNPGMFDFDELMDTVPAATGGVFAARWALKQSGAWEAEKDGTLVPGFKQAIGLWIAAHLGGQLIGSMMGDASKGSIARIAALGFAGDLFMRARFMRDSDWVKNNLSLQGVEYGDADELNGFQAQSALGAVYTDAVGNQWTQDGSGNWVPASGVMGELVEHNGNLYQVLNGMGLDSQPGSGAMLAGFQSSSALGGMRRARSSHQSSFGYATGD